MVPRRPASPQRLGPSRQRTTHGPAQESKTTGQTGGPVTDGRSGRGGTAPACRLWPTSPTGALTLVSSRLRTVSLRSKGLTKHYLRLRPHVSNRGMQRPCSLLFFDWRNQSRLGPTDRGRPPGKDQGTNEEEQGEAHKSNHDTRDRTLYTYRNSTLQLP